MATRDEILESIGNLTVFELTDLIEAFKQKFGVVITQAAPIAAPLTANTPAPVQEEFTITITSGGSQKIPVIKEVRSITNLGLKEAKDLVDAGGKIKEGISQKEADEIKKKLEALGATVEIK